MAMNESSRVIGTQYFKDEVSFAVAPVLPANSIGDREFKSSDPLAAGKVKHRARYAYSQGNVAAVTETRGLGIVHGVGVFKGVYVSNSARATGNATVTVDVRLNGVTVLTAPVTLNNANPAAGAGFASMQGVISGTPALAKGDVIDAVITAAAGTGVLPTQVMVEAVTEENPE